MAAPTDETLLREYLAGNAASFELLVRRHAGEVFQFVLRFTKSSAAAEDVVQETFLQVHTAADRFDPTRRVKPWLFTIAANKARDALRRNKRRREVPLDAQINGDDETGQRFVDLMSEDPGEPDTDVSFEEQRRAVRAIVAEMPERLNEVLILAYFHRFPYKEIAAITGVPVGTVKSRLHSAVAYFGERYRAMLHQRTLDEL